MKKNRLFKGIALAAAVALCAGLAGGCSTKENMEESGQVSLKVGDWLNKSEWPKEYALNEERVNEMRESIPISQLFLMNGVTLQIRFCHQLRAGKFRICILCLLPKCLKL